MTVGDKGITQLNKTSTTDVRESMNMITNNNDVSINETSREREKEIIHVHKVYYVPETRTRHRKVSYANIVRGS